VSLREEGGPRAIERHQQVDAEGRFAAEVESDGSYTLAVHADGRGLDAFPVLFDHVRASEEEQVFVVGDTSTTTGRIVGSILGPDGKPAQQVDLVLNHVPRWLWRQGTPDPETGRFAFRDVPPGGVTIQLRSSFHPWIDLGTREVVAGETLDLGELRFETSERLRATLRGGSDERIGGLAFFLGAGKGVAGSGERNGRTFVSGGLAPGEYVLWTYADGLADVRRPFEIRAGKDTEIAVDLVDAGTRRVLVEIPEPLAVPEWISAILDPYVQRVTTRAAPRRPPRARSPRT
jgi:hypothetical protein